MPKKETKKASEFLKKENFIVFIILIIAFFLVLLFYYKLNIDKYDITKKYEMLENKVEIFFGDDLVVRAEVANSELEKSNGLMYRESLDENSGMLFNFSSEKPRSFWMKNTLIPLDIIFMDKNKKIVDIIENMQPCKEEPCTIYETQKPSQYALEVNAGYVNKNNLKTGNSANFEQV